MKKTTKIGIIICDRYSGCAGGKCFKALKNRDGGFKIYGKDQEVEIVGYTTCGGCPGGNIEYAPEEMKKNGAEVIHLATGFLVGYPPCPYLKHFKKFIEAKYELKVVYGTHPIPEKYYSVHKKLGSWQTNEWQEIIKDSLDTPQVRIDYNE
ncbi:MAG: CGGC domain-containing protein [Bacteroidales bacterium]|nr:CGGC domain-containing protein [Bacteroidales bacterium]MCF8386755.1 CGGC domain-containing protein [Bacteroidales bacterium]MCF8398976.1 CGGC domain-containing protein [Bacteroidales bacterium]